MIKISFVGDITCDRPFLQAAHNEDGQYFFQGAFGEVKELFSESDYLVGNLETVFCGSTRPYNKGLHYNTPDTFLDEIKVMGVHMVTTANNHCFDGGIKGLERTEKLLKKNDIDFTGTYATKSGKRYIIKEFSGVKIAFFSYTYGVNINSDIKIPKDIAGKINLLRPCQSKPLKYRMADRLVPIELRRRIKIWLGRPTITKYQDKLYPQMLNQEYLNRIASEITQAKKEADFVIFCLHIGGQFNEIPGEYSEYMMQFLKEHGVDAVIGHHPHTIQKTVVDDKGVFAYSLGGFSLSPSAIYIHHDCKPEYSQALHLYIDEKTKKCEKASFSLLKIKEDDNAFLHVMPVFSLYHSETEAGKQLLREDVKEMVQRITGRVLREEEVQKEYLF